MDGVTSLVWYNEFDTASAIQIIFITPASNTKSKVENLFLVGGCLTAMTEMKKDWWFGGGQIQVAKE